MGSGGRKGRGKGKAQQGKAEQGGDGSGNGSFYFDDDEPESGTSAARDDSEKKQLKLQKKLREVEALERRRDAGEQLEPLQLKKLGTRPNLEEELQRLQPVAAVALKVQEVALQEAVEDLRQLQQEQEPKQVQRSHSSVDTNAWGGSEERRQVQRSQQGEEASAWGGPGEPKLQRSQRRAATNAWGRPGLLVLPGQPEAHAAPGPRRPPPSPRLRPGSRLLQPSRSWQSLQSPSPRRLQPSSRLPPPSSKQAQSLPGSPQLSPSRKQLPVPSESRLLEQRLRIPGHATPEQRQSLRGDLQVWEAKFGCRAELAAHGGEVIACATQDAIAELRAILDFTFGSQDEDDLTEPDVVFACCDTDNSGFLDEHELRFALNAFGLFPTADYIEDWMDGSAGISRFEFRELLRRKLASAPSSMRRPPAVPYSRRGINLAQLVALSDTFVGSGWLLERCQEFNRDNEELIASGKAHKLEANLYALDRFVIRPATDPGSNLPRSLRVKAALPEAQHKCSYSELANPNGLRVDCFVSHYWGHPFTETMAALRSWSLRAYAKLRKPAPPTVVFWLCALALNQHCASDEVGSSPEEGPFNAALMQASAAVMVLDEHVNPFRRIWCLFEVKRLTDLGKDFELVCTSGPVGDSCEARTIGAALEHVSAFGAAASSESDKLAIWHRVADPALRKLPLELAQGRFGTSSFKRFDMIMRGLLATPLFRASVALHELDVALHYIGLGASFGARDLDVLQALCEGDICTVQVAVKSWKETVNWTLAHCAAYFGHAEALEGLLDRGAALEAQTRYGLTPLMQATRNGHVRIAELLLERRAELEARTRERRTALHGVAHQGYLPVVEVLLHRRADVHSKSGSGTTALHGAAEAGHAEVVQALLAGAANPAEQAADGRTALHNAAKGNHAEVASLLLARRGKELLARRDKQKLSALELAEAEGHFEVADAIREAV